MVSFLEFHFVCSHLGLWKDVRTAHMFQMINNVYNNIWHTNACLLLIRPFFQVSNMFIMSLAIADLTVGAIVMPISSAYAITG